MIVRSVGVGRVGVCMILMTGTDLLGGDTGTPPVSRQSEEEQGMMCLKECMYGVVCKSFMWSFMTVGCSLPEGHDKVPCLGTTTNNS